MDVWLLLPSADPIQAAKHLPKWRDQGYMLAAMLDDVRNLPDIYSSVATIILDASERGGYKGYPWAIRQLLDALPNVLCVLAADDMDPDPRLNAAQIAEQFVDHFPDDKGIMQPTGDPFMTDEQGRSAAARICGSPWMMRDFALSLYGGHGPFHPGYRHLWADEDLYNVAINNGWLWQRSDLAQMHDHYTRRGEKRPRNMTIAATCHAHDESLFKRRKAIGFPNTELLP